MTARVLIVEDEAHLAEMLRYNLEAAGFLVSHAETGEEAELLVAEQRPDLVLLDWMLPQVSGIELCRRLRNRPETRSISWSTRTRSESTARRGSTRSPRKSIARG